MLDPLLFSLVVVFLAAFAAPWVIRFAGDRGAYLLALAPFSALVVLLAQMGLVADGQVLEYRVDWFSRLNCAFALRLDGLALLMALLILGIGGFIVLYAGGYLKGHAQLGRFFVYLLAFMGAMLGLVLSDNLLLLFIFWELTSITSYLLIGFNHEAAESRWKALQALLVTGLGAMAMLAGFILLGVVGGSFSLVELNEDPALIVESPWYLAMVLLVLAGAFTKSAQVPFHFWLPNAMAAPTPVSAYLHSATMVKAGVFLLARLNPLMGGTALWGNSLALFGSVTLLLAVVLGLLQRDLKAILAYTTLGVLGMLTMLLGIGTEAAILAMVGFLFAHALYKAALFMVAGSVDHEAGTRDVRRLSGLRGLMPRTALAGGLAALSMCGLPPFFGFIAKELVYKAGVKLGGLELYFLGAAFVGSFLMMALALAVGFGPFFGKAKPESLPKHPHEAPWSMWIGPLTLAGLSLLLGLFPAGVGQALVAPAVAAIAGTGVPAIELKLWHGVNVPLLLSVVTVLLGYGLYRVRGYFGVRGEQVLARIRPYGAEAMYERIFYGVVGFSKWQTRRLQTGRLHDYVFMIVLATCGLLAWAITQYGGLQFEFDWSEYNWYMFSVVVMMLISTFVVVRSNDFMTSLVGLGMIGFGVALIFVYYGAPDLAITQLLVETLTVVLFLFVIFRLPAMKRVSATAVRVRDALLALSFGGLMTLLVLKAVSIQFHHPIAEQLAEWSYPEAKGKNVVNVILVDFRALDTLGEITVVTAAALGIAALAATAASAVRESRED